MNALIFLCLIAGVLVAVLLLAEGKSGKSMTDHFDNWCKNHLPW